jgi:hypothetical protein
MRENPLGLLRVGQKCRGSCIEVTVIQLLSVIPRLHLWIGLFHLDASLGSNKHHRKFLSPLMTIVIQKRYLSRKLINALAYLILACSKFYLQDSSIQLRLLLPCALGFGNFFFQKLSHIHISCVCVFLC